MIRFVLLYKRGLNGCGRRDAIGSGVVVVVVGAVVAGSVVASGSVSGDGVSGTALSNNKNKPKRQQNCYEQLSFFV